jgi:hypothetical protein
MVERLVLVIFGLSTLVGMVITAYHCSSFWQDFLPNFFSDLLVGVLIAGFVSWLLSRTKKVAARVTAQASPIDESTLNLGFSVQNTGRVSFRADEIYWHVFVDDKLDVREVEGTLDQLETPLVGRVFKHYRGLLKSPAFVGRGTALFSLKVELPQNDQYDLYYFLSTAHGLFPKGLKTGLFSSKRHCNLWHPVVV